MRVFAASDKEWKTLTLSDFRGRAARRIEASSVFFPGYDNAMETCGRSLDTDTCHNLAKAEEILAEFLKRIFLEISCYREKTFDKLIKDKEFAVPEADLVLKSLWVKWTIVLSFLWMYTGGMFPFTRWASLTISREGEGLHTEA